MGGCERGGGTGEEQMGQSERVCVSVCLCVGGVGVKKTDSSFV